MADIKADMASTISSTVPESTEGGLLTRLWRKMLLELGYLNSPSILYRALNDCVARNASEVTDKYNTVPNAAEKTRARSTYMSNIVAKSMSFKTFLDLIFNVLNVKSMKITITFVHEDNTESMHSIGPIENPKHKNKVMFKGQHEE